MFVRVLMALVFVLFGLAAQASETKKVKLSAEKIVQLINGLQQLGGYDRVIKDGTSEKLVHDTFKFGAGLRLIIGKDIAALMASNATTVAAQRALLLEISNGVAPDKGSPAEKRFNEESLKLLAMESEVELMTISIKEMKLDDNPVPGPVLALLEPILED